MRRRLVFAGLVGVTIAGGFIACGIDESGQASDGGLDASVDSPIIFDSPIDVPIDVPQACKTLDATACLGDASVPDGWTYAVITPGDMLCPTTLDYDKTNFLTNVQAQGPCLCGCAASGTIDCSGHLEAGSGNGGCNDVNHWVVFDAGNSAACINTNWNDPRYAVPTPPTSMANAQCDASAPAPGWTASTETSCTPKCTADYCAVGNTYKRCIITSQSSPCPAPFTQQQPALGIEAGVVTACTGCTCAVGASAKCAATIQPFNTNTCDAATDDASIADDTCNTSTVSGNGGKVFSFMYTPSVPTPTCVVSSSGTPLAQFASSVTVCCLP